MTQVSYSSGSLRKDFVCVEVFSTYIQTGPFVGGPTSIEGVFTNAIGQTINVTISVGPGGVISTGGFDIILGGPSTNYLTTVTFDRKYSGRISLAATSLDNDGINGRDRLCNFSIGNPDIINPLLENAGNCIQTINGSNPFSVKDFGWSEVDEISFFNFNYLRTNIASTTTFVLQLEEKSLQKWEKNNTVNPPSYTDPITNTIYPTLPLNVFEVTCEENTELVSYTKELCYKVSSPISFDFSNTPAEPWDAYNGIRPRQDGIPFLNFIGSFIFNEFDPTGRFLYTVDGGTLRTHIYDNFALVNVTNVPLNFSAFPNAAIFIPTGIAVHPVTKILYVIYLDLPNRRLFLANIINNIVNLIGDCQYTSIPTLPSDAHDITFTKAGQLLLGHGENIYLVDHTTGLVNTGSPSVIPASSLTATFSINNISRYHNGDIHISGIDSTFGPSVIIYDGESYTKLQQWTSDNSITPPTSIISTAYPLNPEIKFNRLYVKNIETNQLSYDDRDIITGRLIDIVPNASITDCTSEPNREVSWAEDMCYIVDNNIESRGLVQIDAGQIVSIACNMVPGFIPPVSNPYDSFTHNKNGTELYAMENTTPLLDTYTWVPLSNPVLTTSTGITGLIGTPQAIRTRWRDNSLWVLTEQVSGDNRFYRFYTVNRITGEALIQGTAIYPATGTNDASFTWGIDDEIYFSYSTGLNTYRVSTLSKGNYYINTFVADTNYVINNINTDLPNQRLILSDGTNSRIEFMTYLGDIIESCPGIASQDAIQAPSTNIEIGDTAIKVKKIFIKDLVTGEVTSFYHDYLTGKSIVLPPLARIVNCTTGASGVGISSSSSSGVIGIPRFQVISGQNTWSQNVSAPTAKSITLTRITNAIIVDDGFIISTINSGFSHTWTSDTLGGNLVITGVSNGSEFIVSWIN